MLCAADSGCHVNVILSQTSSFRYTAGVSQDSGGRPGQMFFPSQPPCGRRNLGPVTRSDLFFVTRTERTVLQLGISAPR